MNYETRMELGRLLSDPIEQIFQAIIAHPKLYQAYGDPHVLNFLINEKKFVTKKKRLFRASSKDLDLAKVRTYLEEYRVFRSIVDTGRTLPIWIFETDGGAGIEQDRDRVFVAVTRLESDVKLIANHISRLQEETKEFILRFSLRTSKPEEIRELEVLFDRIMNHFVLVQHGMKQLLDSSLSSTMIMPEKSEIATFKEQFQVISESVDRLEVFIQTMIFPFLEDTPVNLLEGEGLQEVRTHLNKLVENSLKIQRLALTTSNEKKKQ